MKIRIFLITTALLIGCNNYYNVHLDIAESLIISNRIDSAWNILCSINSEKLSNNQEQARYALLFTQAQYKKFIPIKSDSLISIAVDYYIQKDQIRYTQALMYKGVALQDMGLMQEAMNWYKKAEAVCDTTDYLTLGLLNSRMGELYQTMYIVNDESLTKYKKALYYYRRLNHLDFINYELTSLGKMYRLRNIDSALLYLNEAIELAQTRNDSVVLLENRSMLATTYNIHSKYLVARELALSVVKHQHENYIPREAYHSLVYSYAHLGQIDSARYFFQFIKNDTLTAERKVCYYITLTEIAKSEANYKDALNYNALASNIADSIVRHRAKMDLYNIEKRFDNTIILIEKKRTEQNLLIWIIVSTFSLVILIIIIIITVKRKNMINNDNLALIEHLQKETEISKKIIFDNINKESQLKAVLDNHIKSFKELIEYSYRYSGNTETFMSKFKENVRVNKFSQGVFKDIKYIVNEKYSGLIDHLQLKHPNLSNEDLNFISLMCCGFSYIEMTVCLGYINERSTCNSRVKLAKKLNLGVSLDAYLQQTIQELK